MSTISTVTSPITFRTIPPVAALSDCVELLWSMQGTVPHAREKILPTEHIELIFNLGQRYRVFKDEYTDQFEWNGSHWICGIQSSYLVNEAPAHSHLLGIRFKPGGFFPFLGFDVTEIKDQIVDLELLWGGWIRELHEKLLHAQTTQDRFTILQRALLQKGGSVPNNWSAIQYAVQRLKCAGHPVAIQSLSDDIGWSQKHFIQEFKRFVGTSPKTLSRITRLQRLLHTIEPGNNVNWTDIALHCHYYDHSHFNRDFRAFAGLAPSDYLRLRSALFRTPVAKGESVQFVPLAAG